jgi:acyl carrier protein
MADSEATLQERMIETIRKAGRVDGYVTIRGESHLVDDLAIDSLDLVGVYLQIQDDFGVEIAEADIPNLGRVADLVAYVAARRPASSSAAA